MFNDGAKELFDGLDRIATSVGRMLKKELESLASKVSDAVVFYLFTTCIDVSSGCGQPVRSLGKSRQISCTSRSSC